MGQRRIEKITRRLAAKLLFLAGVLAIAWWAWANIREAVYQSWTSWTFERETQGRAAPNLPGDWSSGLPPIRDGDLIGRLVIPRLHLRAMVREGAGAGILDVALGHIPGTAMPGREGNAGVAGHRDTLFRRLGEIRKNDVIRFQTTGGEYLYEVESTRIVTPRGIDVLRAGGQPEMTLVTCYPFRYVGAAPGRFIVKARLVASVP